MNTTTAPQTTGQADPQAQAVFDAIEQIAATAGKKDKEAMVLKAGTEMPLFMEVAKAAYDTRITYGVATAAVSALVVHHGGQTPDEPLLLDSPVVWGALARLADRHLTGHAARDHLQSLLSRLTPAAGTLLVRMLLRDLRAGFTDGTLNRAFPKTLPEWPYMRCSLPAKSHMVAGKTKASQLAQWDWSKGVLSQLKADGMFVNVNVSSGFCRDKRVLIGSADEG